MPKSKYFNLLIAFALLLLSTGTSYWLFKGKSSSSNLPNQISATPTKTTLRKSKIDPSIPRTEACPLNGALFTKQEQEVWAKRRPLAVMVENSVDARPQSGLSTADIIYEAVAEGGITRFMAMFYCDAALSGNLTIAPVRSARIYFVNLVSEYDALYTHVGGAGLCDDINVDPRAKALCAIRKYNMKDLDEIGKAGDFKTCHRLANRLDRDVAYEHTMACFLDELYTTGEKWGWTNVDEKGVSWDANFVPWKFKATADKATGKPATSISYMFWQMNRDFNKAFDVSWKYDATANSYSRYNDSVQTTDLNTTEPLAMKNVVVEFAKETFIPDLEKHMLYDVIGTGNAIVFTDGVAVDATWTKLTRTSRTIYKDKAGKEIKFTPGPIWISIVPTGNDVQYQ